MLALFVKVPVQQTIENIHWIYIFLCNNAIELTTDMYNYTDLKIVINVWCTGTFTMHRYLYNMFAQAPQKKQEASELASCSTLIHNNLNRFSNNIPFLT